jgi:hypothetical protein
MVKLKSDVRLHKGGIHVIVSLEAEMKLANAVKMNHVIYVVRKLTELNSLRITLYADLRNN